MSPHCDGSLDECNGYFITSFSLKRHQGGRMPDTGGLDVGTGKADMDEYALIFSAE
jgi:hypothetical protein